MKSLRVALLQILPQGSLEKNLQKGIKACEEAKKAGADIALFPEMWSSGYDMPKDPEKMRKKSVPADSDFVLAFGKLAAQLEMAIAITFLERYELSARNTLVLFDRYGKKVLTYAKVHTCDFDVERNLTPGEDFYVTDLDTAEGRVKIGAMICFDREFPESARILMLKGAELILVPNACPMEINRLAQLRGRAFENMLGIATCNYPNGQPDCNGHSSAFDGVAYLPEMTGSRDICILQAGSEEGIFLASFDLDLMRKYRKSEVHGNAYRHPKKYGVLVDERIEDPFVRSDYRA
ncbi:MAG: carbon-nitrogen hydrolase family protein [Oscillospiraceae bacterium]